jgi:hypothetical protein
MPVLPCDFTPGDDAIPGQHSRVNHLHRRVKAIATTEAFENCLA